MRTGPTGTLVLSGELDFATIKELQDKIDEIMVPGQPIVLDLADLTFLDSSAMHCLVGTFEREDTSRAPEHVTCPPSNPGTHDATARGMGFQRRESVLEGPQAIDLPQPASPTASDPPRSRSGSQG